MSTEDNLQAAFAGESQANRKYLAFARQAEEEGLQAVARLFRVAAVGETIHAHTHLRVMGGVGNTKENLEAAISGETAEFEEMYPAFIKEAEGEGNKDAARSFNWANNVEKIHAELYKKALEDPEGLELKDYYVCGGCGFVALDDAPEKCPNCGAPREMFIRVE